MELTDAPLDNLFLHIIWRLCTHMLECLVGARQLVRGNDKFIRVQRASLVAPSRVWWNGGWVSSQFLVVHPVVKSRAVIAAGETRHKKLLALSLAIVRFINLVRTRRVPRQPIVFFVFVAVIIFQIMKSLKGLY